MFGFHTRHMTGGHAAAHAAPQGVPVPHAAPAEATAGAATGCSIHSPRSSHTVEVFTTGTQRSTFRVPRRSSVWGTITVYCCSTSSYTGRETGREPVFISVVGMHTWYDVSIVRRTGFITV